MKLSAFGSWSWTDPERGDRGSIESRNQASQSVDGKLPRNRRFKRTTRQTDEQVTNLDSVVVNLSSAELTESEKSLFSKGLNFCTRPKSYDKGKLVEDSKAFTRRMRLKSHFADRGDSHSQEKYPDFIPKSDWQTLNKVVILRRL